MNKIIVPIDFSKCSVDALKFAAVIAKKVNGKIHMINVIQRSHVFIPGSDPPVIPTVTQNFEYKFYENLKKEVTEKFLKLQKALYLKNIEVDFKIVISFNVYEAICEYAKAKKAALIIIGSRGLNGIKEILIGSNAQRVAAFSKVSVLVTPYSIEKIKTIVFASDFSEESYDVFPAVKKFANLFEAEIHLLKVNTHNDFRITSDNMELIKAFMKKFGKEYKVSIYDSNSKEDGILKYSESVKADVIAIGHHGRTGISRFFRGDISGGITRLTTRPVLLINFQKKS